MSALLTYPFEADLLPLPADGARGIVFNAQAQPRLPEGGATAWTHVQGFRPLFLSLRKAGGHVVPEPGGRGYDLAMVVAGRHRRQNEAWIAQALRRTSAGGTIVVAGGKTDGIASLRKRVGALLSLAGAAARQHGVVFWLRRPADVEAEMAAAALDPALALVEGRYVTGPGMFSADAVDPASRLLADHLPADLGGRAADFCAGWGYLAARLAEREAIRSVDLYEADHASLDAARRNMAATPAGIAVAFHWHDLAAEVVAARYDAIAMNPPFHQGRAAEPDLGIRMIDAARAALKPGGRLFLVANRQLPYERAMAQGFKAHGELAGDGRFKVLWGVR